MRRIDQLDIVRAVLTHFHVDSDGSQLTLPDNGAVVLWIVDGFGLYHWRQSQTRGLMPTLFQTVSTVLEGWSVYPSTTSVGLASLAFAVPPNEHGALGYWIYLPEYKQPVNMLSSLDQDGHPVPPALIYPPRETIFTQLRRRSIQSSVVGPAVFQETPLTQWLYHGAQYRPYGTPLDAILQAGRALADGARFVWLYWPYIDSQAHLYGMQSPSTDHAISELDAAFSQALHQWKARGGVTLIITADHGMIDLLPDKTVSRSDPALEELWAHTWAGERRAMTSALDYRELQQELGAVAAIHPQEQCWDEGWYGGPPSRSSFRDRVLQSLVLAQPGAQFEQNGVIDVPLMSAAHGGITPQERAIPIGMCTVQ